MIVNDGGTVTCNGKQHELPSADLLNARALARDLEPQAQLGLDLPPGPRAVLSYTVHTADGSVRFSDTSARITTVLQRLAQFTKDVTEDVCGIERN